ncbi:MAG: hypothetical protein OEO77_08640 [Acidimicrobiia bacterium]|nr:hypothetical protein [Acidimicrobiia bacterium]
MFEAIEFTDVRPSAENPNPVPIERHLGSFDQESVAIETARAARDAYMATGREGYVWWTVRQPGARLANWIADSHSPKEFMLDLTSGELVEM